VTANAQGVWSFTPTGLADGVHAIVASQTDTFNNTGTASLTFTLDTSAPAETLAITAIATDTGGSSSDFITSDTTLTVSGSNGALAAGEKIQVSSDGGATWTDVAQTTTTSWSLVDGATHASSFTYQARIVDTAGNVGTTASQAVTIDTVAPAVAITTIEGGDNLIDAAEAAGGIQVGGTAEIGSTLTVNGTAVTVDGTGHWTTSVTPAGQGALVVTAVCDRRGW